MSNEYENQQNPTKGVGNRNAFLSKFPLTAEILILQIKTD